MKKKTTLLYLKRWLRSSTRWARRNKWKFTGLTLLFLFTLTSRICVAYFLANDGPGDGVIYARLAKNVIENGVYSIDEEAPFQPTLIRLPGYPLFMAGVYWVFGHDNNTAVRVVQGVFDTGTCVLAALLAWMWTDNRRRKRRNAFLTFLLVALCPFVVIYTGMILTETLTAFLMAAMTLTATLGLRSRKKFDSFGWWAVTGILAGLAVLLRPDAGLFAAAIGLTLVISGQFLNADRDTGLPRRLLGVTWKGIIFTLAFLLVLTPWTIRNYKLFGVFQPLAPTHAEMPGEFVSHGYFHWLRTWVDDSRFTEPMLWNLGEKPIHIADIPAKHFDSLEERDRVAALLEQYNHPPGSQNPDDSGVDEQEAGDADPGDTADENSTDQADENSPDESADSGDEQTDGSSSDDDDEDKKYVVAMTPEIDAGFEQIAQERIERSSVRYYLWVPIKRAGALWFDSHSLYYPFGGQMSPIADLDYDVSQQYWLPAFTLVTWIFTLLALGGVFVFWRSRANRKQLQWLILIVLMTLPRIIFFATIENPEPRYVVELFVFVAILSGIFLGGLKRKDTAEACDLPRTRLVSLDVFRGMTTAAMTLVNEPGTWSAAYPPLLHAEWNGATPTDWIFPFFLFIVGASISVALGTRMEDGNVGSRLYTKIIKRGVLLVLLGLGLEAFPFYNIWTGSWLEPGDLRIMGVLQRIAICYAVTAIIFLKTGWRTQAIIIGVILLGYWALMTLINVPGCDITTFNDQTCNLAAYIDRLVLTQNHIWNQSRVYDPEGLLATLPAIVTTLLGMLAGSWLRSYRREGRKVVELLVAAAIMAAIGWIWSFVFPLNKTLWTSSYVLYTAGIAVIFLAALYWLIDLKGYRRWSVPFIVFGTNAIALYVGTTLFGKTLDVVEIAAPHDTTVTLQETIFNSVFLPLASPEGASLLYATAFVLIWLAVMWVLYWRKVFLKI